MSKETKRQFKLKRERAELLNKLYYYTVLPFLFHHLFKVFYYLFRLLFFYPRFLKSSTHFEVIEDLPKGQASSQFDIHEGSFGEDRKILKKNKSLEKGKPATHWFAKLQPSRHAIREIVTTGVFELLQGKEHAAKARLMRGPSGNIYSISKLFENFDTFGTMNATKRGENKTFYHAYLEITENLEGYEEMLAVTLLLGRDDCHKSNWGVVKNGVRKLAATFDYGVAAMESPFSMYELLKTCGHFHERIVSERFLHACEAVIEKFEKNHDEIEAALFKGIEAAEASFWWWEVPTVNDIMRIFSAHKRQLKHLCHHIRAELAILNGDPQSLQTSLKKLDPAYKNYFTAMSLQRRYDFFVDAYSPLNRLIEQRRYSRVFLCTDNDGLPEKIEINGLYLVKINKRVIAYGGHIFEQNSEHLHLNQVQLIEAKTKFPDRGSYCELTPELSKEIISICRYPQERDPKIAEQLSEVYNQVYPSKKN